MTAPYEYVMHPSNYSPPLGHPQVDICLSAERTQRFFDVMTVRVPVVNDGQLEFERVVHHGAVFQHQPIFPGRIVMMAHDENVEEVFSFGGEMMFEIHADYTICRITSPAPIFSLGVSMLAPHRLLMDEVLALIAKERARWHGRDDEFWGQVAHLDPYQLFVVMLHTLQSSSAADHRSRQTPEYSVIQGTVQHAIDILVAAEGWPATIPTLAEAIAGKAQPGKTSPVRP